MADSLWIGHPHAKSKMKALKILLIILVNFCVNAIIFMAYAYFSIGRTFEGNIRHSEEIKYFAEEKAIQFSSDSIHE